METRSGQVDSSEEFGDMPSLLRMPAEILERIFASDVLQPSDLSNASLCCWKLNEICTSKDIWRTKLGQRWPHMLARFDRKRSYNWFDEYKARYKFGQSVIDLLKGLSPKYYLEEEVSREGFQEFTTLMAQHDQGGEFIVDELMSIIHEGDPHKNLTLKYYAEKSLRFMQQTLLAKKVSAFMELPPEKQFFETGATLLAQWCQPTENITENVISDQLDQLAEDVKDDLRENWAQHPVISAEFDHEDVTLDMWSCDQCQRVLEALNRVLFQKHGFRGNKDKYYDQKNSYIDKVLKLRTGIPITLSIVYAAVARRLGVVCEPVNAPSHFLLRWKQHPMSSVDQMYTYIDAFNGGKFMSLGELPAALNVPSTMVPLDSIRITRPTQVVERMIRNLVAIGREQGRMGDNLLCLRNALELSLLISPNDFEQRLLLVRVNLHLNINLPDVISCLQAIADEDQNRMGLVAYLLNAAQAQIQENKQGREQKKIKVKTRKKTKDAIYSVGLIMKHKRYDYNCVIYGWDSKCEATQEWILQMGVNALPHKDKQPFYNVLVEDGTNRYAAQENLEFNQNCTPISHPEVGKYFDSYEGTHYLPNEQKDSEYPQDVELTAKLVHENYHL